MWQTSLEHDFTGESDFAAVPIPPLEDLLEMAPIAVDNGFTLCVQIGSPADFQPGFTRPEKVVAPISISSSLADLLDSASGDVHFVCLEHFERDEEFLSRKRVIHAHSEILKARSDYFKSLLAAGFKEVEGRGGKVTIVVEDADFVTMYWLLQ
jgi:hypothetical protein